MRRTRVAILASSLVLAFGCDNNNNGGDAGPGDAGMQEDACTTCGHDSGPVTPDSGPVGDDNDTFATADDITLGEAASGVINPPGDLDYYKFEGTAGQWIEIVTAANPDDDPEMLDTVITLYDSSMQQIAENDDSLPRADTDSGLVTRLPADGTYYVLVQEWSTWAGETDEGGATFTYDLTVADIDPTATGVNVDTEGGNDAATAQALGERAVTGGAISFIVGTFADASDVDVYSFTIAGADAANFSVNLMPSGTTADGAAANPTRVRITNADGSVTIASLDPSVFEPLDPGEYFELNPSLPAGEYRLFIEGGGSADFYVIKAIRSGDNPPETDDAANNDPTTPNIVTLDANPNAPTGFTRRSGFLLAQLGDSDTDYFSIDVIEGEHANVYCASRSAGSGVVDLTVTLMDSTGATDLAHGTETATEGAFIEDFALSAAGTYLVRLTKASQDAEVTGDWVRCGIHLDAAAP